MKKSTVEKNKVMNKAIGFVASFIQNEWKVTSDMYDAFYYDDDADAVKFVSLDCDDNGNEIETTVLEVGYSDFKTFVDVLKRLDGIHNMEISLCEE